MLKLLLVLKWTVWLTQSNSRLGHWHIQQHMVQLTSELLHFSMYYPLSLDLEARQLKQRQTL